MAKRTVQDLMQELTDELRASMDIAAAPWVLADASPLVAAIILDDLRLNSMVVIDSAERAIGIVSRNALPDVGKRSYRTRAYCPVCHLWWALESDDRPCKFGAVGPEDPPEIVAFFRCHQCEHCLSTCCY